MSSVGKYEIGERIGGGGMAEVYRAKVIGEAGFARKVAIKRVLPSLSSDEKFSEMFINEAQIAAKLNHPNIVSVTNFARDEEGQLFLVMEMVEGVDLLALLNTGRIPVPLASFITGEVLRALAYAHQRKDQGKPLGIVHRDISPQNVLMSWEGAVKVSDFGIAKAVAVSEISRTTSIKGKVGYVSPEHTQGMPLDGRADLFAVGVILHEMLTGQPHFTGRHPMDILKQVTSGKSAPPSSLNPEVPKVLDEVCLKLLERDRELRYPSAEAALAALAGTQTIDPLGMMNVRKLLEQRFPDKAGLTGAFQAVTSNPPPGIGVTVTAVTDPPMAIPVPKVHSQPPSAPLSSPALTPVDPGSQRPAAPMDKKPLIALALAGLALVVAVVLTMVGGKEPSDAPVVRATPQNYLVRLNVSPATALIQIDGATVGSAPFFERRFISDGKRHTLVVSADGYRTFETTFRDAAPVEQISLDKLAGE